MIASQAVKKGIDSSEGFGVIFVLIPCSKAIDLQVVKSYEQYDEHALANVSCLQAQGTGGTWARCVFACLVLRTSLPAARGRKKSSLSKTCAVLHHVLLLRYAASRAGTHCETSPTLISPEVRWLPSDCAQHRERL